MSDISATVSDDFDMGAQKARKDHLKTILAEEDKRKKMARSTLLRQISVEKKQSKRINVSNAAATQLDEEDTGLKDIDQLRNFRPLRVRKQKSGRKALGQISHQQKINDTLLSPGRTEAAMLKEQDEEGQLLRRRKEALTDEDLKKIPRMVHRNMPFHQSRNDIAVFKATSSVSPRLNGILKHDWYHVILRWPTAVSLLSLLAIWTIGILIFALIYQAFDDPTTICGLGPDNVSGDGENVKSGRIDFSTAFAFSLETCTTVGYGLPNGTNGFFEPQCKRLQFLIYLQMVFSMMFNGFLFAFMFARLARCESRAVQVLFSDKAIIEIKDGKWFMHVRVYDMDSAQPVIEAHIRMYCISWRDYENQERDAAQPHLLHHMRILVPNDDLGSMMFTSIPANCSHHIDHYSPLAPMHLRKKVNVTYLSDLELREVDDMTGNRSDIPCPVCGETFGVVDHLERHIKYMQVIEKSDDMPVEGTHRDPLIVKPKLTETIALTEKDIKEHLLDKEIMCVVEAIEPMVSGTFQALQSYKLEDMVFGGNFAPCMSQKDGKIFVDVNKFHKIIPPSDASLHYYNGRDRA